MIKLEYGDLTGMKSEFQGVRDLSGFRHFEIGVFNCLQPLRFADRGAAARRFNGQYTATPFVGPWWIFTSLQWTVLRFVYIAFS